MALMSSNNENIMQVQPTETEFMMDSKPDKMQMSLEYLNTVGISENCVDKSIAVLEKLTELLTAGKCEWTRTNVTNPSKHYSKIRRLKWASTKFTRQIESTENLERKLDKIRQGKLNRIIVRNMSAKCGLNRLRKEKAIRTAKLYENEEKIPQLLTEVISDPFVNFDEEPIRTSYPESQSCYVCKVEFTKVHDFYDQMCPPCADLNFSKRSQSADLSGKVALVTGGRIKIGYEVVLKLLRCGTTRVITTTRFPQDAAKRFASEPDFVMWKDRLDIYGLDLRFLSSVEKFCHYVNETYPRLDILIQNAAQTIRRPPAFYEHLVQEETLALTTSNPCSKLVKSFPDSLKIPALLCGPSLKVLPENTSDISQSHISEIQVSPSALASQLIIHPDDDKPENKKLFPAGQFDGDHQQLDLRPRNSWLLETPEVDTTELVEVSVVNSIAPFVILSKLTPLMKRTLSEKSVPNSNSNGSIILVSAMEGQFYRPKSSRHPHTNCAKASLNMLVRTSSQYYARFGLLMNCVDTGWVTDEVPLVVRERNLKKGKEFVPPLDEIDGAARILDPIFQSINHGVKEYGKFYKDYRPTVW